MFGLFKRKPKPAPAPEMAAADIETIKSFARGDKSLRNAAIAIHYKYIPTIGVRGNVYQVFMAEVDHPVPDHLQIAAARDAVIKA